MVEIILRLSYFYLILLFFSAIASARSTELKCGVCLALVDEMLHEINSVDPKLRIQVGSFRIDPQGNQKLSEIPLARSEVHLIEKLEEVCSKLHNYGISITEDGNSVYLRKISNSGEKATGINLQNLQESSRFEHACHNFVEEHEEDIVPALQSKSNEEYHENICIDIADVCSAQNVTEFEDFKSRIIYTSSQITPETNKVDLRDNVDDGGDDNVDDDGDDDDDDGGDDDDFKSEL